MPVPASSPPARPPPPPHRRRPPPRPRPRTSPTAPPRTAAAASSVTRVIQLGERSSSMGFQLRSTDLRPSPFGMPYRSGTPSSPKD